MIHAFYMIGQYSVMQNMLYAIRSNSPVGLRIVRVRNVVMHKTYPLQD
jgi:hypothetical protein